VAAYRPICRISVADRRAAIRYPAHGSGRAHTGSWLRPRP
jgi:hypothetical protein